MGNTNKQHKWIAFFVVTISAGLIYRVPYLKTVFYDALVEEFQLTNTQVGTIMSVYSITKMIIYIPGGILADRFDNRKMLVGSNLMLALLTFWYATIPSLTGLMAIQFLLAFSNVVFWVSAVKAIRILADDNEQGSIFGYSEGIRALAGVLINFAALAVFNHFILTEQPLRYVLIFYGIVYTALTVAMWLLLPKKNKDEARSTATLADYLKVLKIPGIWIVAFLVMCAYSAQVASEYTTTYLTTILGMTTVTAGIIATIRSYGIGIFSAPIMGKISDKTSSYSKMVMGLFVVEIIFAALLLFIPGKPNMLIPAIVTVIAFATVMYAIRGIYFATMGEAGVPKEFTGTATGIICAIGFLPDAYMNLILGKLIDNNPGAAGFKFVFGAIILFALLGIVFALVINRMGKKNRAA